MRVGAVHPGTHFFISSQERFHLTFRSQDPGAENRCPSPLRARFWDVERCLSALERHHAPIQMVREFC